MNMIYLAMNSMNMIYFISMNYHDYEFYKLWIPMNMNTKPPRIREYEYGSYSHRSHTAHEWLMNCIHGHYEYMDFKLWERHG